MLFPICTFISFFKLVVEIDSAFHSIAVDCIYSDRFSCFLFYSSPFLLLFPLLFNRLNF